MTANELEAEIIVERLIRAVTALEMASREVMPHLYRRLTTIREEAHGGWDVKFLDDAGRAVWLALETYAYELRQEQGIK